MDLMVSICIIHMLVSETMKGSEAVDRNTYNVITLMLPMQVDLLVVPLLVELQ